VKNTGQRADLGKKSCTNTLVQYEIIQYERTFAPQVQMSWNQAHAPLLIKSFPKTPRTRSEASQFSGSHNYKTKQTTFIDRWANMMLGCASGCYFWARFSFGTFVIKTIRISGLGISN
jgi:hypothetical protein